MHIQKFIVVGTLIGSFMFPVISHAQVQSNLVCPVLTTSLYRGETDARTGGRITQLQQFLTNYLHLNAGIVTGYFGPKTYQYLKQFQIQNGLSPVGLTGPLTRAAILKACAASATQSSSGTTATPSDPTSISVGSGAVASGGNGGNNYNGGGNVFSVNLPTQSNTPYVGPINNWLTSTPSLRLAMGEHPDAIMQSSAIRQKHFDDYKSLGIGLLRFVFGWNELESSSGIFSDPWNILGYMKLAANDGLHFKVTVGSENAPPAWFFKAHPDAQMTNQVGDHSANVISYWYPGLQQLLAQKDDQLFQSISNAGLMGYVDYIIIPMGPAGEAWYPAAWTMGYNTNDSRDTFWFYDTNAEADFRTQMQTKYGTIANANAAWGTNFATWSAVVPPKIGEHAGPLWNDVLTWYRDTKRNFVIAQIEHYKELVAKYAVTGHTPELVLAIPGDHLESGTWTQAVSTAGALTDRPGENIRGMADTEFLLQQASQNNIAVQYTGYPPEEDQLAYVRNYMDSHGYTMPLFIENAGGTTDASSYTNLAANIKTYKISGFDFIGSTDLFGSDFVTTNATHTLLANTFADIATVLKGGSLVAPVTAPVASTPTPVVAPTIAAPTGLTATCNTAGDHVTLSWNSVANATYYKPRISISSGSSMCSAYGWQLYTDGTTCYPNPDTYAQTTVASFPIVPGKQYNWWVEGNSSSATGAIASATFSCQAPAPVTPTAPAGLTATCNTAGDHVSLSWNPVSNASYYQPRVSVPANSALCALYGWQLYTDGTTCYPNPDTYSATSVLNFPVLAGTVYNWWVGAINSVGVNGPTGTSGFTCRASQ